MLIIIITIIIITTTIIITITTTIIMIILLLIIMFLGENVLFCLTSVFYFPTFLDENLLPGDFGVVDRTGLGISVGK